jgi:hypothetical protein
MPPTSPLITIPAGLLGQLDEHAQADVCSADPHVAAVALLELAEELPPFSSLVSERSKWLALARELIAGHVDPTLRLEVPLLSAIAQTAFAAREMTPALTASEQALVAASELDDVCLEASIRARRLPHLSMLGLPDSNRDAARLREITESRVGELTGWVRAEIALAEVAMHGLSGDLDRQRRGLASLARLPLPQDERLTFVAYATHCSLAQLSLRERSRMQCVKALIEAARLASEMHAYAELANLQAILAAFAVRTGDFDSALAHAGSSLDAARLATSNVGQPDPWLGFPIDVSTESECSGVIRVLAEAAVSALDRGDRIGFLVLVTGLVAFYLLDDRAPEALDALNESIETAEQFDEERGTMMLHGVSESLLRHMGMLK